MMLGFYLIFISTLVFFSNSLRTIGTAVAGIGILSEVEITLFEHEINDTSNRGMITYMWFTGDFAPWENTYFKFYIDDIKQSLDLPAYLSYGQPEWTTNFMFGNELVGKGASRGGVYSTLQIPFQKKIKVNFVSKSLGQLFFIVRGFEGSDQDYPPMVNVNLGNGMIDLPSDTTLHVDVIRDKRVELFEKVTLTQSTDPTAIFLTVLQVQVGLKDSTYLEGCFRAYLPSGKMQYISSGTEDYFQSADYFDGGKFQYPESGIVYWNDSNAQMYRFHNRDAMIFDEGVKFMWRNCETISLKTGMKCSDDDEQVPKNKGGENIIPITMSSVVWSYTWEKK